MKHGGLGILLLENYKHKTLNLLHSGDFLCTNVCLLFMV